MAWYRRAAAGLLVTLSLVALATIGYSSASGLVSSSAYNYQYCTTPSQYQYCSTSTSTTSTTTPTSTSTSTVTSSTTTPTTTSTSTITSTTTTPTTTSTSTISSTSTTSSSTSSSTSTSTTTPTSTKPGKGCGDKNHLHDRRFECKVAVGDFSAKEGKAGTSTAFNFKVSLSDTPLSTVTVSYSTASGTATSGSDFFPASGTLSFPVGVTSRTVTVYVIGDKVKEANESFYVNLSNPSANAYLGDGQALGSILNDD